MGLIDKLRKAGGIIRDRLASSIGALRTQARGLRVRVPRVLGLTARAARLTTPLGIGITAATFAPQIIRGLRVSAGAISRGIAFVGGRQVVTAAGAGGVVGVLSSRRSGRVTRPSESSGVLAERQRRTGRARPRKPSVAAVSRRRAPAKRRAPTQRRRRARIPAHGHKVISTRPGRRRAPGAKKTHRRPRHPGHKRVSFTTKEGKKVSFLAAPGARHR